MVGGMAGRGGGGCLAYKGVQKPLGMGLRPGETREWGAKRGTLGAWGEWAVAHREGGRGLAGRAGGGAIGRQRAHATERGGGGTQVVAGCPDTATVRVGTVRSFLCLFVCSPARRALVRPTPRQRDAAGGPADRWRTPRGRCQHHHPQAVRPVRPAETAPRGSPRSPQPRPDTPANPPSPVAWHPPAHPPAPPQPEPPPTQWQCRTVHPATPYSMCRARARRSSPRTSGCAPPPSPSPVTLPVPRDIPHRCPPQLQYRTTNAVQ